MKINKIYIRKVFDHDTSHEVSVAKEIVQGFFDNSREFTVYGIKSKTEGIVSIHNATDFRFGKDCKKLLIAEGEAEPNDLIVFYKEEANKYKLEILKANDANYLAFFSMYKGKERHMTLYIDEERFDEEKVSDDVLNKKVNRPHQRIFFGAPGTGKSYKLNQEAKEYFTDKTMARVTFHPNYMYGNFVGTFKPFSHVVRDSNNNIIKDENGNTQQTIRYEYVEGILIKQLIKAFENPNINYLVLIEEINRANVAAVFGDTFQLLDRDKNGDSEYTIATSKELQDFLKLAFEGKILDSNIMQRLGSDYQNLYLPKNLYIWATMNSADQGVMPMDTAFRRRWEFTYIGVDDAVEDNKINFAETYKFLSSPNELVLWNDYRCAVNDKLSLLAIPEDKLIGPYFISKACLENGDKDTLTETLKNKLLMYLYEDVVKGNPARLFAEEKCKTFSMLCKYFSENALNIFKEPLNIEVTSDDVGDEDLPM